MHRLFSQDLEEKMKIWIIFLTAIFAVLFFGPAILNPQTVQKTTFPYNVNLSTLDNTIINSGSLTNNGKPMIVIYWATTCKPCVREQNEINKRISKWKKETGVRIIAITPEPKSKIPTIKEIIRKYDWKHEFYVDYSKRLRYKLLGDWHGVPQTFVFDGQFKILYHGFGYRPGSIDKIEKLIYKI